MARRKTPREPINVKASLSRRLRELRAELFGEHGGPELARRLGLPARTWYGYESGVTVPAEVLLSFIEQTGASPMYLLTGEGPRYMSSAAASPSPELSPIEAIRQALERLERSPAEVSVGGIGERPEGYVPLPLFPLERIGGTKLAASANEGEILALRSWISNPAQTIAARLTDDAMFPILPSGSIVAIDRSWTDPHALHGRIVAAWPEQEPMIRWLEVTGRHMILRPNNPGRPYPLIPIEIDRGPSPIIGQVICSWSRLHEA